MNLGNIFKPKMGRTIPVAPSPGHLAARNMPVPNHHAPLQGQQVNVQREFYTMASADGNYGEITMYGTIVQERPMNYWTGEPVEGEFIILSEFMDDLKHLEGVSFLTIHLHSTGGDGYSSVVIHNKLREMSAHKTVIVDGVAMSGGSLIMCSADVVKVNLSSIVMIHKCWCLVWGYYNADEMRKMATANDAMDKSQAAIYKRKCGLDDTEILKLMSDETYMTGAEAVEAGFADEIVDGEEANISASADRRTLFVNGHRMRLPASLSHLPESIPTVETAPNADMTNRAPSAVADDNEGGNKPMASTIEELRTEYPALVEQLEANARATAVTDDAINAAVSAERKRIQEIDAISASVSAEMATAAKFGDDACSAKDLAFRVMQQQAHRGQEHLEAMNVDYMQSGVAKVPASPAPQDDPVSKDTATAKGKEDYARLKKGEVK